LQRILLLYHLWILSRASFLLYTQFTSIIFRECTVVHFFLCQSVYLHVNEKSSHFSSMLLYHVALMAKAICRLSVTLILQHSDSEIKYCDSIRFSKKNRFFSIRFSTSLPYRSIAYYHLLCCQMSTLLRHHESL